MAARLKEAALGRLGLARKARAVLAGFAKVEAAIASEPLAAVLLAADAAEDGAARSRRRCIAASAAKFPSCAAAIRVGGIEFGNGTARCDTCCRASGGRLATVSWKRLTVFSATRAQRVAAVALGSRARRT